MGADYSMTSDASYLSNLLLIPSQGGIFERNTHIYGPYITPWVPTLTASKPISIAVSEAVFNNVLWVYFQANKIRLDNKASNFGYNFTIFTNTPPAITINPNGNFVKINGTLNGYFEDNGTLAFSIIFQASFTIELYITLQGSIFAQVPELKIDDMAISYSFFIRRITDEAFLQWLMIIFNTEIPQITESLNKDLKRNAIELPALQGVNWKDVTIQRQNSWIVLSTDITF